MLNIKKNKFKLWNKRYKKKKKICNKKKQFK